VVQLDVESKSKAVINDDEYAVLAKMNNHTMDVGVPDSASLSTQTQIPHRYFIFFQVLAK
jgi:long-subunit fatty acid transport protein